MWENLTKDPLIRMMLVVFIGILTFGIFFNLLIGNNGMTGYAGSMGGGEHTGNMGSMGGSGYPFGNMIGGLLMLLINILVIVLVISVVAGIVIWAKNTFYKGNMPPFAQTMRNDPFIRTISIITAAVIGLMLVMALFNGFASPGYIGMGGTFGVSSILVLLIKLLIFVLTISLLVAAFIYIREQYDRKGTGYGENDMNLGGTTTTADKEPYNSDINRTGDK